MLVVIDTMLKVDEPSLDIIDDTNEVVVNTTEIKIHQAVLKASESGEAEVGTLSADGVKYVISKQVL